MEQRKLRLQSYSLDPSKEVLHIEARKNLRDPALLSL
jgi:hypothetical protein